MNNNNTTSTTSSSSSGEGFKHKNHYKQKNKQQQQQTQTNGTDAHHNGTGNSNNSHYHARQHQKPKPQNLVYQPKSKNEQHHGHPQATRDPPPNLSLPPNLTIDNNNNVDLTQKQPQQMQQQQQQPPQQIQQQQQKQQQQHNNNNNSTIPSSSFFQFSLFEQPNGFPSFDPPNNHNIQQQQQQQQQNQNGMKIPQHLDMFNHNNGFQIPPNQFSPVLNNNMNNMNNMNGDGGQLLNFSGFQPFMGGPLPMFNQSFPFANDFMSMSSDFNPPPPMFHPQSPMSSFNPMMSPPHLPPPHHHHPFPHMSPSGNMMAMGNMQQQQASGPISLDNKDGNILMKLLSTINLQQEMPGSPMMGHGNLSMDSMLNMTATDESDDEPLKQDLINKILNSTTTDEEEATEEIDEKSIKKIEKKRTLLPTPSFEKMKDITAHAYDIFEKSKCEENRGRALLSKLQNLVSKTFPKSGVKLHLFGSSANGMSLKGGDIDICMIIENYEGGSDEIIEKLAEMLKVNHFKNILAIPTARVPIVKFKEPNTHLSCDICINNKLALFNTNLVRDYSMIDERMRPLVYVVKRWAKRRKINEPSSGTLSSYAYINMVISFLQSRSPPILPCLQELANGVKVFTDPVTNETREYGAAMEDVMVDGFNCKYYNDLSKLVGFGKANTESLGSLLFHFFQAYAREFSFMNEVVSIKTGHPILKTSKTWETMLKKSHYWFSIEDPFETTHNLARVVNRKNLSVIISELNRAYKLLSKNSNLHQVCREFIDDS